MQIPSEIGGHRLVAELGRGTTGVVYEAVDDARGRRVALKIPILGPGEVWETKAAWFMRECRAAASIPDEPRRGIPTLYAVGQERGIYYAVRELVEGRTLKQLAVGALIPRAGLWIVARVAEIVHPVHVCGIAHRNISPENVLIGGDGTTWLIGFGRATMLAGEKSHPRGPGGTPPEIDIQGLQGLLAWVGETLDRRLPDALEALCRPGVAATAGAFADAVRKYLKP